MAHRKGVDCELESPLPRDHDLCLAPLRGLTDGLFRRVFHRHFGGVDRCMAPFVPTVTGQRVKPRLLAETAAALNEQPPVIPQVLGADPAALRVMLEAMRQLGCTEVNLNAGCPDRTVVRRGRGAALIAHPSRLWPLLDAGCDCFPGAFSLKVRLGVHGASELYAIIARLNGYPLSELIVHPRTADQAYEGCCDLDAFARVTAECRLPVVYNGDIRSIADARLLRERFPAIRRWMIGRGLVADPLLAEALRSGRLPPYAGRVTDFLSDLLETGLSAGVPSHAMLGRMKAVWTYCAAHFEDGQGLLHRVHHCASVEQYREAIDWNGVRLGPAI